MMFSHQQYEVPDGVYFLPSVVLTWHSCGQTLTIRSSRSLYQQTHISAE